MKKFFITVLVLGALAAGGYWFLQQQNTAAAESSAAALEAAQPAEFQNLPEIDENMVEAIGRLVPLHVRDLNFRTGGVILEVAVEEGQKVQEGDVIARLRDEQQMKLSVSQARLEVANAEKVLSDLEHNAPLQAAQAFYDMAIMKKEMDKIQKRRTALDYPRATQEEIDDAYETYMDAEDAFKQVANYFKATDDTYKGAKKQRDNALSAYNWLISKYSDLEKLEVEADYMLHERNLAERERLYELYSNGPDPEEVAIANSRLEVAKEQLAAAEAAYDDLVLRAPFSGVIAAMNLEEGQVVGANQPVLTLADFSGWLIETEDLTELSIPQIQVGDTAEISIDAIPNTQFTGKVVTIKPIGETRRGDITYTVVIRLDKNDPLLRWNMTSPVSIVLE